MTKEPRVAVFRPADERMENALTILESLGLSGIADPMLTMEPTGARPRTDADYTILTSTTGAAILAGTDWTPAGKLCAIGESTATALQQAGFSVDIVPETYTSSGLVERLDDDVAGARVEVARSDHGSPVLLDGLEAAGAYIHETILYRLHRPPDSGHSAEQIAAGEVDAVLFTSSLTVDHFLDAAREREVLPAVRGELEEMTVGVIGEPTARTARDAGISVDVVPDEASFEALARATSENLDV